MAGDTSSDPPSSRTASARPASRRGRRWAIAVAVLALLLLALRWLSQPPRVSALVLNRAGAALGLQIRARGTNEYRVRGMPMLVLRDVTVHEPGAAHALLYAERIYVAVPWSTLRSRGGDLTVERIELDAPQLDLPALQHWLATRPPTRPRLPTLTRGLRIRDGMVAHRTWRIDGIHVDVAQLDPARPMHARVRGRYQAASLTVPVDLAVSLVDPRVLIKAADSGLAVRGTLTAENGRDWRLPATVTLSGPLHFGEDGLRLTPARLGVAATLETGDTRAPIALGVHGPLRLDDGGWTLAPAGIAVRARGDARTNPIPSLDARGALELDSRLAMRLDGDMRRWPPAWPALPPPLGRSASPLSFVLDYAGDPAFTDVAALQVRRDATRFDARFRLPQVLDWVARIESGNPLPPMSGTLATPRIEMAGMQLEGVEIALDAAEPDPGPQAP